MALTTLFSTHPRIALVAAFALYKALLLLIAAGTLAFADYDTSTARFIDLASVNGHPPPSPLAGKLLRWDAIYFVHTAQEGGYVYEQSWAFGIGFSAVIGAVARGMRVVSEAAAGVVVAHVAHLVAVMALYELTLALGKSEKKEGGGGERKALIAALIHVVAPAGIFLSAPYAESSFAALSFVGAWLFALGGHKASGSLGRSLLVILSGVVFGVSALFRSNALLNGLVLFAELVYQVFNGLNASGGAALFAWRRVVDMAALCIGGLALAVGFAAPQVQAWVRYCSESRALDEQAEWCGNMPPSIYGYVQSRYWNVGFLRYWTPNQIPLFLLAAPMLSLLIYSGISTFKNPLSVVCHVSSHNDKNTKDGSRSARTIQSLATAQTLLAVLALTSYHVQIINRISSGYVVWCWWTAAQLGGATIKTTTTGKTMTTTQTTTAKKTAATAMATKTAARAVVIGSVVYGCLQAGLFAAFMPPA